MSRLSRLESLKIKAKLLQKAKKKAGKEIALKDALQQIAQLSGFENWRDLKENFEENQVFEISMSSAHWHVWYASYNEALKHLHETGGFLLPYQKHFFICNEDYIKELGLAMSDNDLLRVGNNWAEPQDKEAWLRLKAKIKKMR
jgi:hypothetical protein